MIVCTCGQRNVSGSINYCTRVSYSADKTICMCMCRNCPDTSSDEAGAGREKYVSSTHYAYARQFEFSYHGHNYCGRLQLPWL